MLFKITMPSKSSLGAEAIANVIRIMSPHALDHGMSHSYALHRSQTCSQIKDKANDHSLQYITHLALYPHSYL